MRTAREDSRMTKSLEIVVADDDPVLRALLQLKLEGEGHTVRLARDGEEALRLASADPPGLLVLDVVMPGIDGLEVTRRLRERPETATLPIVLLTGRDTDPDIVAGWKSGANYYITKPFVIEHLRYFIKTMQDTVEPDERWDDNFG
jgi:DNA-binding response OmpR family regulator